MPAGGPSPGAPLGHDPARRAFFRELGRQAFTTVGQVAGLADVMSRGSTAAAASLLGIDLGQPARPGAAPSPAGSARAGRLPAATWQPGVTGREGVTEGYRSPYRLAGDALLVLDQRTLPGALEELTCRRGSDVAYYLRVGACRGGPLMAQLAAYGVVLTARERQANEPGARAQELRRTREALVAARPSSRLLAWACTRMARAEAELGESPEGATLVEALRAEADAIAVELQLAHASVAQALVDRLTGLSDRVAGGQRRPLGVLLHGDPGALWGGSVGTGITALARLAEAGRALRVFVTETRPFLEGARLASWELRQAGIAHRVVADGAVAWLLDREAIDAVLLAGEWIAANGDTGAVVGSRSVALLATRAAMETTAPAAAGGAGPLVIVSAASATIDPSTADGAAIPADLRPARELTACPSPAHQPGGPATTPGEALNPATDVVPAAVIGSIVTERGTASPVTREGLAVLTGTGA